MSHSAPVLSQYVVVQAESYAMSDAVASLAHELLKELSKRMNNDALYTDVAELVLRLLHPSPEGRATAHEALGSRLFV